MIQFKNSTYYIQELNYRLFYTAIGALWVLFISYRYKQTIIFFTIPKGTSHLISTNITEIVNTYIHLCVLISAIWGLLLGLIQLYFFLRPGLHNYESNRALAVLGTSIIFYIYGYIHILPNIVQVSWDFFLYFVSNWNAIQLNFEPRIEDYFKHMTMLIMLINLSIPILIIFLFILIKIPINLLLKNRKIIYIIIFLFSATITPPDLLSQIVLTIPLLFWLECLLVFLLAYGEYKRILIRQPIKTNKKTRNKKKKS